MDKIILDDRRKQDRRRSNRFPKKLPVRFNFSNSTQICRAFTDNVSASGAMLNVPMEEYSSCSDKISDNVALEVNLPENAVKLRMLAAVVWKKTDLEQKTINLGLEFTNIAKNDSSLLNSYLSSGAVSTRRLGGIMRAKRILLEDKYLTDRERRNLSILEMIRKKGPVSRTEISQASGINIVTVSNYIDNYIKLGLVVEGGLDVSTGGRRPELIELNPNYGYVIGVDLGMLGIENPVIILVLADLNMKVLYKTVRERVSENPGDCLDVVKGMIKEVVDDAGIDITRLLGIGVALAGIINKDKQTVRNTHNDAAFDYSEFVSKLSEQFDIPVVVENDHFAAVLGEKYAGLITGRDVEDMLFIAADVACGVMTKGQVNRGISRSAGETNINPPTKEEMESNKPWCRFEDTLRARGLDLGMVDNAKKILGDKKVKSKIVEFAGSIDKVKFGHIVEAVKAGDKIAIQVVEEAGEYLGVKVALLINLLNPEVIVIGRYIDKLGDVLLKAIIKSVHRWAFEECFNATRIVLTTLGDEGVALGVSSLIMQEAFKYANV